MKIVIDIPESIYDAIMDDEMISREQLAVLEKHIYYGTLLPKGHGRLIDADEFEELFGEKCVGDCGACMPKRKTDGRGRWYDTCLLIDTATTIVEADKAESKEYVEERLENYNKLLKSGILDCLKEKPQECGGSITREEARRTKNGR